MDQNNKVFPYEKFKERIEQRDKENRELGEKISQSFAQFLLMDWLMTDLLMSIHEEKEKDE